MEQIYVKALIITLQSHGQHIHIFVVNICTTVSVSIYALVIVTALLKGIQLTKLSSRYLIRLNLPEGLHNTFSHINKNRKLHSTTVMTRQYR